MQRGKVGELSVQHAASKPGDVSGVRDDGEDGEPVRFMVAELNCLSAAYGRAGGDAGSAGRSTVTPRVGPPGSRGLPVRTGVSR